MKPRLPLVVAEVSANHLGSLDNAIDLVMAIGASGASHIKFQTYTADTMTIACDGPNFQISTEHELWGGRNLYDLYSQAYMPWEWQKDLFQLSRSLGLTPFSTPFDCTAVDFLEELEPELYKIASMEIGDLGLISRVARTRKPLILSTGTASLSEIDEAVETAQREGCSDLTLLLCTSSYPTQPSDTHLARMALLRDRYQLEVGLSDHTLGIGVSIASAVLGASVIERHVTLCRSDGGPDAAFSIEPAELATLVQAISEAVQSVGCPEWRSIESESESKRLKRSLYLVRDCQAGEVITKENVRSIRPAGGLAPRYLEFVLGKRLVQDVRRGTPLTFNFVEGGEPGNS